MLFCSWLVNSYFKITNIFLNVLSPFPENKAQFLKGGLLVGIADLQFTSRISARGENEPESLPIASCWSPLLSSVTVTEGLCLVSDWVCVSWHREQKDNRASKTAHLSPPSSKEKREPANRRQTMQLSRGQQQSPDSYPPLVKGGFTLSHFFLENI